MTEMTDVIIALQRFLGGFGIPAYQENSVPKDAVFPYITYSPVIPDWDSDGIMSVRIWDFGGADFSIQRLASYVDKISQEVGDGVNLRAGAGYVCLSKSSTWAQLQPMEGADVRVAYLNFQINVFVP